jgi:hypothetical protein
MWITLTADHVQNSLSKAECDSLAGTNSAGGLQDAIRSVVGLIRGKIQTYQMDQNNFGPEGTIPEEVLGPAIAIARFKFLTTLPGTQLITKWREQENTHAYTVLNELADGKLLIADVNGLFTERAATTAPSWPTDYGTGEWWFRTGGRGYWREYW